MAGAVTGLASGNSDQGQSPRKPVRTTHWPDRKAAHDEAKRRSFQDHPENGPLNRLSTRGAPMANAMAGPSQSPPGPRPVGAPTAMTLEGPAPTKEVKRT